MAEFQLTRYDAARVALEKVVRVDEAKEIRDRSIALQAYARQAKDHEMLEWITEIRIRAERRTGELLAQMEKQHGARGKGKKVESPSDDPTLADIGITKNESSLWQKLAAVPKDEFEKRLKESIDDRTVTTTKKILRSENGNGAKQAATHAFDLARAWGELEDDLKRHRDRWPWEQRAELARILREFADGVMATKREFMR